ncbi:MAG: hypothetical protein ACR2NQ_06140 [Thermodesulfobacteriota bacterium]
MKKTVIKAAVFALCVLLSAPASAFVMEPDPFGFSSEKTSAYELGPYVKTRNDDRETGSYGFRPFFHVSRNLQRETLNVELLYPFFNFRKDHNGYNAGFLFNLISLRGEVRDVEAAAITETSFRIYPLLFYRSSEMPGRNLFSFAPFYGNFGGKVKTYMFPFYLQTRSETGVSHNILWPLIGFYSDGREGFRFWPLYGSVKDSNSRLRFALWPLYLEKEKGRLEDRNYRYYKAFFPFYYRFDYQTQSHRMYLWPLFQKSTDSATNLKSYHVPWPLINFSKSDNSRRVRFFPFFEKSEIRGVKKTRFILWPLYTSVRFNLTSSISTKDTFLLALKIRREIPHNTNKRQSVRVDLWPLFTYRRDERGAARFHMFSPIEPFIGSSGKLYRNYAFLWRPLDVRTMEGKGTAVSFLFGTFSFRKSCEKSSFLIAGGALGYSSDFEARKIRFLFLPVKIGEAVKNEEMCRQL